MHRTATPPSAVFRSLNFRIASFLAPFDSIQVPSSSLRKRHRRQFLRMLADILRPCLHHFIEAFPLACEQCPRRFLKTRLVSRHRRQEAVCRLLSAPPPVSALIGQPRLLHNLAKRHRCAAGPPREPVPVSRQKRHLSSHHAQPPPPR